MATLERKQEILAEHFRLLADALDEGEHSDKWLDVFEEATQIVNQVLDLEDDTEDE
jgi:hypothetical protein